jgi:hypothetical protein
LLDVCVLRNRRKKDWVFCFFDDFSTHRHRATETETSPPGECSQLSKNTVRRVCRFELT